MALPPVPLPQFGNGDFNISHFNTAFASIVKQVNALTPLPPGIRLRTAFISQFDERDFKQEGLAFLNNQLATIVGATNKLVRDNVTNVEAVQLVQLRKEDFEKQGIPVVSQYLTNIITRLNAVHAKLFQA